VENPRLFEKVEKRIGLERMNKLLNIKWEEDVQAAGNARKHLPALVSNYFQLGREIMARHKDAAELHPLRLATKRLRYTLELFKACYGPGLKTRLAELQALQQILGDINDTVVGARAMNGFWRGKTLERARVERFLRQREQTKVQEFRERWNASFDAPGREQWWTGYLARHSRVRSRKL
jgi:CHAD domain-containing protein